MKFVAFCCKILRIMSEVPEKSIDIIGQEYLAENEASIQKFEALLELAIGLFISDRSIYEHNLETIRKQFKKAKVTDVLSLWVVRGEIEQVEVQLDAYDISHMDDPEYEAPAYHSPADLLKPNIDVQIKIEAFGKSVIEEAFACLGEDAAEQVAKYKAAKTEEEKLAIFEWLDKRLMEIYDIGAKNSGFDPKATFDPTPQSDETSQDDPALENELVEIGPVYRINELGLLEPIETQPEEAFDDSGRLHPKFFYHPTRLSPKLIGQYPNNNLAPTCLGISILASSFLEQTGDNYLHGGVIMTGKSIIQQMMVRVIDGFLAYSEIEKYEIPPKIKAAFKQTVEANRRMIEYLPAFHGTALVKVSDENWLQIDPNFKSTALIRGKASEKLSTLNGYIQQHRQTHKGLELKFGNEVLLDHVQFNNYFEALIYHMARPDYEIIAESVKEADGDTIFRIINMAFLDYFDASSPFGKFIVEAYSRIALKGEKDEDMVKGRIYNILKTAVKDFALEGNIETEDLVKYLAEVHSDPVKYYDLLERLRYLPIFGLIRIMDLYQATITSGERRIPNTITEVGAPYNRIGACILSDLALHTDFDLTPTFWLSNWPSHIAFGDHSKWHTRNSLEKEMLRAVAYQIDDGNWTYRPVSDIIIEILEDES